MAVLRARSGRKCPLHLDVRRVSRGTEAIVAPHCSYLRNATGEHLKSLDSTTYDLLDKRIMFEDIFISREFFARFTATQCHFHRNFKALHRVLALEVGLSDLVECQHQRRCAVEAGLHARFGRHRRCQPSGRASQWHCTSWQKRAAALDTVGQS